MKKNVFVQDVQVASPAANELACGSAGPGSLPAFGEDGGGPLDAPRLLHRLTDLPLR